MKRVLLLVFIVLLHTSKSHGQFQKTYGSPNGDDLAYAAIQTSDGGFALTGYTQSLGVGDDILVMKLNASGDMEWAHAFGGPGYEEGKAIIQAADGGFVIGGAGDSYGSGSEDFYLIKTDAGGSLLWFKSFGGPSSEYFEDMTMAPDGGFVLIGTSLGFYNYGPWDIFLVKTDEEGELEWSKQIDLTGIIASGAEEGFAIDATSDGGYILSTEPEHLGNSGSSGGDVCIIKISSSGDVEWYSTAVNNLNAPAQWDFGYSIHETNDHGFIASGTTNSFDTEANLALYKMDSTGGLQWSRFYNLGGRNFAYSCLSGSWGGFAIAGGYHAFTDSGDVSLIVTDDMGIPSFVAGYGGDGDEFAFSIYETTDQAFLIAGRSNSFSLNGDYDVYLLKTDSGGTMKYCPKREYHLTEDSVSTEKSDPLLTIDDPETVAGSEIINNNVAGISATLICPTSTDILEPMVEEEIRIPTLLEVNQLLYFHASYHYRVFDLHGRLLQEGYGKEIRVGSAGFYIVMIEEEFFKVVVVNK